MPRTFIPSLGFDSLHRSGPYEPAAPDLSPASCATRRQPSAAMRGAEDVEAKAASEVHKRRATVSERHWTVTRCPQCAARLVRRRVAIPRLAASASPLRGYSTPMAPRQGRPILFPPDDNWCSLTDTLPMWPQDQTVTIGRRTMPGRRTDDLSVDNRPRHPCDGGGHGSW